MDDTTCHYVRFAYECANSLVQAAPVSATTEEALHRRHGRHLPFALLIAWHQNPAVAPLPHFVDPGWELFLELAWTFHEARPKRKLADTLKEQYGRMEAHFWYARAQQYAAHIIPHALAHGPEMRYRLPRI